MTKAGGYLGVKLRQWC